jgi:hypothetical protein
MDFVISKKETLKLLSEAFQIGFQKGCESDSARPKYLSQNKAYQKFKKSRVQNWVKDGLIAGKPNGNGKTSTVYYEYAKLMELDMSDKIVIRKPHMAEKHDNNF